MDWCVHAYKNTRLYISPGRVADYILHMHTKRFTTGDSNNISLFVDTYHWSQEITIFGIITLLRPLTTQSRPISPMESTLLNNTEMWRYCLIWLRVGIECRGRSHDGGRGPRGLNTRNVGSSVDVNVQLWIQHQSPILMHQTLPTPDPCT